MWPTTDSPSNVVHDTCLNSDRLVLKFSLHSYAATTNSRRLFFEQQVAYAPAGGSILVYYIMWSMTYFLVAVTGNMADNARSSQPELDAPENMRQALTIYQQAVQLTTVPSATFCGIFPI